MKTVRAKLFRIIADKRVSALIAGVAGLFMPFLLAGCLWVPGPRAEGMILVPALPPVVVLEAEPYYVQGGYHYHYQNNGWYYSNSRSGPWAPLPRDRYPKEVRYKDNRGKGQNSGHQER